MSDASSHKSISDEKSLITYINLDLLRDNDLVSKTFENAELMVAYLRRICPPVNDITLEHVIEEANQFSEFSIQLRERLLKDLRCEHNHQIHVHLSGFGAQDFHLEMLIHSCKNVSAGGYPVIFCKHDSSVHTYVRRSPQPLPAF